jgi:hypothetical protein
MRIGFSKPTGKLQYRAHDIPEMICFNHLTYTAVYVKLLHILRGRSVGVLRSKRPIDRWLNKKG